MNIQIALLAAALLAGCTKEPDGAGEAAPAASAADANAGSGSEVMGMGVVTSVDVEAGTVTIAHEPIPSLNWPAMTMAFKGSPELLAAAKQGERIHFQFEQVKGQSRLKSLSPAK